LLAAARFGLGLTLATGASGPFSPSLHAAEVSLTPVADTSIFQAFPSNNFGGNEYLTAGTTQNYTTNRGLIRFDPATALPRQARIISATLVVEVVGQPVDGDNPSCFQLRRVLRDWGEGNKAGHPPQQSGLGAAASTGEANWTHAFAETCAAWDAPGGQVASDFTSTVSGETFVYGTQFSPYQFDSTSQLVADLQDWLQHPERNFGWMLTTRDETNNFTARRFATREDPFRAPRLDVVYFVPKIDAITVIPDGIAIQFTTEAGAAYAVEYCDGFASASWHTLTNIAPGEASSIMVHDATAAPQRYYRLTVP
jgi:hypothetical protein